jgi:hypothetical protein
MKTGQFEDAVPESSMRSQSSISPLVALMACIVMLLLLLAA